VKRNPGKVNYGSAGAGSLTHLTMELFKQETGAFMLHIPYRGIAPAINDLLGGQTQAMFPGSRRRCRTCAPAACARWPSPARSAARS
jgi:tripartite-type tricarboxylate transporter receptor subunit TctC